MNRASFLKRVIALTAVATLDPTSLHTLLDKETGLVTYPEILDQTIYVIDPMFIGKLWLPGTHFVYDETRAQQLRGIYMPGSGNAEVGAPIRSKGLQIITNRRSYDTAIRNLQQHNRLYTGIVDDESIIRQRL
jgi:hypothetical protein